MSESFFHGIDHITVGVKSLTDAVQAYQRLGFTITPQGHHERMGTCNHCIIFGNEYLEITTPADDGFESKYCKHLQTSVAKTGDGVKAVAFGTHDGAGLCERLNYTGIQVSAPEAVYRNMTTEDGSAIRAALSVVRLPEGMLEGIASAAVQHVGTDAWRKNEWKQHPNSAIGVTSLTFIVDDPIAAKDAYEQLFGAGIAAITDSTVTIHLGEYRIFLCEKDQLTQLHPDLELDVLPPAPTVVAVGLRVKDLNATETILKANGVNYSRLKEGMIRVPPSETHGSLLEFSEDE